MKRAVAALDGRETGIEAVDHLTAVAARSAPADLRALDDDDLVAFFGKVDRRRQTGIAGADDADIGLDPTLQPDRRADDVAGGGVVAGRVAAVTGIGFLFGKHQTISR